MGLFLFYFLALLDLKERITMKNTISQRVADFLKSFPPFTFLQQRDLEQLSEQISIVYKEKDAVIFAENDKTHDCFYVVHKGAVALKKSHTSDILDMCDEGDIFGLRPLLAQENYVMEARAYEESILYSIPIAIFKPFAQENKAIGNFLIESYASNTKNPYSDIHKDNLYGELLEHEKHSDKEIFDLQPVKYSKKIVTCSRLTTAKQIAQLLTEKKVGAILIVDENLPVGIITDKDLRNKIVTGEFPIITPAETIMTSPVLTYPKKLTVTEAQMAMMKGNISYLCITKDGTPNTKLVGVLSKHDLMLTLGNNPAVLIKALKRVRKIKEIKPIRARITQLLQGYLDQNIPMQLIAKIITELNNACITRVIEISMKKMSGPPPLRFAWLALGSQGRSEQMLHTDQDNAIVYENVSEDLSVETKSYFLRFAVLVNKGLLHIGYDYCPAEMMASNPKWCLSLDDWKDQVQYWVTNPGKDEVLLSFIFFDYSLTYGDSKIVNELSESIFEIVKESPDFYRHLVSGALQNPSPTGFFRQFLVEQNGANKDQFDVKRRALMPLTDAARVLILSHSVKSISNTAERFEKLADLEPQNSELFLSCAYSFKALLKFRTKQGLLHNDSGQFIALETLSKTEKIKLKSTFKTIKELQELISIRFNNANILG
ncbi:inosine-5'-monophosphate dehydrogenase [Flavobacterium sp. TAB 87]|nr:inosine-5'-monophosphate dehydrogenase [Flavobacterium sp. TAB 87]